jgi:hypothetical protein
LRGDILVKTLPSSQVVQELIVLVSPYERAGVEALLLEDVADFLDAQHVIIDVYFDNI